MAYNSLLAAQRAEFSSQSQAAPQSTAPTNNLLLSAQRAEYASQPKTTQQNKTTTTTRTVKSTVSKAQQDYIDAKKTYDEWKTKLSNMNGAERMHFNSSKEHKTWKEAVNNYEKAKSAWLIDSNNSKNWEIEGSKKLDSLKADVDAAESYLDKIQTKAKNAKTQEEYNMAQKEWEDYFDNDYSIAVNAYNEYGQRLADSGWNQEEVDKLNRTFGGKGAFGRFYYAANALADKIFDIGGDVATTGIEAAQSATDELANLIGPTTQNSGILFYADKFGVLDNGGHITQAQFDSLPDIQKQEFAKDKIVDANSFNDLLDKQRNRADFVDKNFATDDRDPLQRAENWIQEKQFLHNQRFELASKTMDEVGSFMYQLVPSIAGMGVDAAVNFFIPGAGLANMGARTYGSSYNEAINQGASEENAQAYGFAHAIIETATEQIGNIGLPEFAYGNGFFGNSIEGIVQKAISKIPDKSIAKLSLLLTGAASEGFEEIIAEFLDPICDAILEDASFSEALGYVGNGKTGKDYLRAFLGGAVISLLGSGATQIAGKVAPDSRLAQNNLNNQLYNLRATALGENIYKTSQRSVEDVANELFAKGKADSIEQATRMAEKQLAGKKLTKEEAQAYGQMKTAFESVHEAQLARDNGGNFSSTPTEADEIAFGNKLGEIQQQPAKLRADSMNAYDIARSEIAKTNVGDTFYGADGTPLGTVIYKDKENGIRIQLNDGIVGGGEGNIVEIPYGFIPLTTQGENVVYAQFKDIGGMTGYFGEARQNQAQEAAGTPLRSGGENVSGGVENVTGEVKLADEGEQQATLILPDVLNQVEKISREIHDEKVKDAFSNITTNRTSDSDIDDLEFGVAEFMANAEASGKSIDDYIHEIAKTGELDQTILTFDMLLSQMYNSHDSKYDYLLDALGGEEGIIKIFDVISKDIDYLDADPSILEGETFDGETVGENGGNPASSLEQNQQGGQGQTEVGSGQSTQDDRRAQAESFFGKPAHDSIAGAARDLSNIRLFTQESIDNAEKLGIKVQKPVADANEAINNVIGIANDVVSGNATFEDLAKAYHQLSRGGNTSAMWWSPETQEMFDRATDALDKIDYDPALGKPSPSPIDVNAFRYAAARAVRAMATDVRYINNAQSARAEFAKSLVKNEKNIKARGLVSGWYLRNQISAGNVFRMFDGFNKWENGIGYRYQQRIDNATATYTATQVEALSKFAKVKAMDGFDSFARDEGTYKNASGEDIKLGNHVLTRQEACAFKMMYDTTSDTNDRLAWLSGISVLDSKGNVVDNITSDSWGTKTKEKTDYIDNLYKEVSAAIANDAVASEYVNAAKEMFDYFSPLMARTFENVMGYGKNMFVKGKYYPIWYRNPNGTSDGSAAWALTKEQGHEKGGTEKDLPGIMQERTRTKGGYAALEPISLRIDSYIDSAADFLAYGELGKELKYLNQTGTPFSKSLSEMAKESFGSQFEGWVNNYVDAIRNESDWGEDNIVTRLLRKGRSSLSQGALLLSPSVPLKQISSYWSSMGLLDADVLLDSFAHDRRVFSANTGNDSNALVKSRTLGDIDPDAADILSNKDTWLGKLRNKSEAFKKLSNAIPFMDYKTVSNVYDACSRQIAKYNPNLNTEGSSFRAKVDTLFQEVLLNTQPIYNTKARAEYNRTGGAYGEFLKITSMFRTQQTQNFNRMITAIGEYKAAKGTSHEAIAEKTMNQTIIGNVTAQLSLSILTFAAEAILHKWWKYKDDEGEVSAEKIFQRMGLNMVESFAGTTWLGDTALKEGIDRISQIVAKTVGDENLATNESYGMSFGPITTIMDDIESISDAIKDGHVSSYVYAANKLISTFGIPATNVYNFLNSVAMYGIDIADAVGDGNHSDDYDNVLRYLEGEVIANNANYPSANAEILLNAYLAGDTEKVQRISDKYFDSNNEDIFSKLSYKVRDRFKSGEMTEEQVNNLYTALGKDEEYITGKLDQWDYEETTGLKFSDLTSGDDYLNGAISKSEAIKYLENYAGYDHSKALDKVKGWDVEDKYGTSISRAKDSYINGEISKKEYREILDVKYEGSLLDKSEQINEAVKKADYEIKTGIDVDAIDDQYVVGDAKDYDVFNTRIEYHGESPEEAQQHVEKLNFKKKFGVPWSDVKKLEEQGYINHSEVLDWKDKVGQNENEFDAAYRGAVANGVNSTEAWKLVQGMDGNGNGSLSQDEVIAYTKESDNRNLLYAIAEAEGWTSKQFKNKVRKAGM